MRLLVVKMVTRERVNSPQPCSFGGLSFVLTLNLWLAGRVEWVKRRESAPCVLVTQTDDLVPGADDQPD